MGRYKSDYHMIMAVTVPQWFCVLIINTLDINYTFLELMDFLHTKILYFSTMPDIMTNVI